MPSADSCLKSSWCRPTGWSVVELQGCLVEMLSFTLSCLGKSLKCLKPQPVPQRLEDRLKFRCSVFAPN